MYKSKYRLSWNVPYQAGEIKIVSYNKGEEVASKTIKTASVPSKISLEADRKTITADGKDLSFITIRIEDKEGNLCPLANNLVEFTISGEGSLAAVGNGDQTSLASFQANNRKAFNGLCLLVIKSNTNSGEISIKATSNGLDAANLTVLTKK